MVKNGRTVPRASLRDCCYDSECECGVETAIAVGMQSRPPLLMQRESNVSTPANAGRMQDKLFFQYSALDCGVTMLEAWNVNRRVIDSTEDISHTRYYATHRYFSLKIPIFQGSFWF